MPTRFAVLLGGGLENRHLVRSGADVSATVWATVVASIV